MESQYCYTQWHSFVTLLRMYHAHHHYVILSTILYLMLLFQHTYLAGGLMVRSVHLKYTHSR